MSTQKNKGLFNLFIFIIVILAVAGLINAKGGKFLTSVDKTSTNQGGGDFTTDELISNIPNQKLIYAIKSSKSSDIYSYSFSDKKSKKIFTDSDESEKIRSIGPVDNDGKILVYSGLVTNEFTGSLYLLNSDGSGKMEKIWNNFSSPQNPIISPDGKSICYTLFSNAEKDFGFKLIISALDGQNKKQIFTDATNIQAYAWSPNSNQIIYSYGENNNISKIDANSLNEDKLINLNDQAINHLSWSLDNIIIASLMPKGNDSFNQADIFTIDKSTKKIISNTLLDDYPYYDDSNNLAYINTDYSIKQNDQYKIGKINVLLANGSTEVIGDANQIIGWSK